MNLSQLELFATITETGSFTEAAKRVGLTRSAASHALANLEAELGVTLLERERGGVVPTTVGSCIMHNVRDILASVETIQQEAASARGLTTGKLRLGIVSSIAAAVWSGVLRKFRQEFPRIELVIFEGSGKEVEDWIRGSVVDVGFVLRETDDIDTVMIGRDEVRVLVPHNHPLRRQNAVTLEQVRAESFILPRLACDFLNTNTVGFTHNDPHYRYEATEIHTVMTMVREGLGITMLPEMLLPTALDGLQLLSLNPPLYLSFGVGVRSLRHTSPAAKMFMHSAQIWAQGSNFNDQTQGDVA